MPILANYQSFRGRHWETGSVANVWAHAGIRAPHAGAQNNQKSHAGAPYSEALLMGISGGAVMGYFSFHYEGYDPHVSLLTRNTFDPLETLLARLGVVQTRLQTAKPEKGVQNLVETLAEGTPAIVWADRHLLPYNALPFDEGWWDMQPIVVYGYDPVDNVAWIADRARVPLRVTADELDAARARIKKDKFRVLTLDEPDPDKLPAAVSAGIWDSINLFTEKPPRGSKNNFGLAALAWWAKQLTNPRARASWAKVFPAGRAMYAGLTSSFDHIMLYGKEGNAERLLFAGFLDEAATILGKPALRDVALQFRRSGQAWDALAVALLPDSIAPFGETRRLLLERHRIFLDEGHEALPRIREINGRLDEIGSSMADDFPLDEAGVVAMREEMAEHVMGIHDLEELAVADLRAAMA